MEKISISVRGFAEVSSANPEKKRSILKKYRNPKSGSSIGRSNYYIKALSLIKRHHKGESIYVSLKLSELLVQANKELDARAKTKLLRNHQAVVEYLKYFGERKLKIHTGKRLYYSFKNLEISAQPDLVAEEDGKLILIKLNLGKKEFAGGVAYTILHVLYEAAKANGLQVLPSNVECIEPAKKSRIAGPKRGFLSPQSLDTECDAFLALCA
jgi:hypothetical protein